MKQAYRLFAVTDVSEGHAASIFTVDEGSTLLPRQHGVISKKTVILRVMVCVTSR
jgi:hypothetical protein